jgi:hypothetical protein
MQLTPVAASIYVNAPLPAQNWKNGTRLPNYEQRAAWTSTVLLQAATELRALDPFQPAGNASAYLTTIASHAQAAYVELQRGLIPSDHQVTAVKHAIDDITSLAELPHGVHGGTAVDALRIAFDLQAASAVVLATHYGHGFFA